MKKSEWKDQLIRSCGNLTNNAELHDFFEREIVDHICSGLPDDIGDDKIVLLNKQFCSDLKKVIERYDKTVDEADLYDLYDSCDIRNHIKDILSDID